MAEELSEGMVEFGDLKIKKTTLVTGLILMFGVAMFAAGIYTGIKIQYTAIEDKINWYQDHCQCSELYTPSQPVLPEYLIAT